jgi:hypothetical protein
MVETNNNIAATTTIDASTATTTTTLYRCNECFSTLLNKFSVYLKTNIKDS